MIKFYIEPGYDVKCPERDYGNAGIDFFIPNMTNTFEEAFKAKNSTENAGICTDGFDLYIHIAPHGRVNIPSGIRSFISPYIALEAQNKSGIATKNGLVYGAATVDASYQGIIHISLINTTDRQVNLPLGTKAVQFIPRLIDISELEICKGADLKAFYKDFTFSNRGEGAFGSTDIK